MLAHVLGHEKVVKGDTLILNFWGDLPRAHKKRYRAPLTSDPRGPFFFFFFGFT